MRSYRFFTKSLAIDSMPQKSGQVFNLTESLEPDIFYQLTKVLRAKSGDKVVLIPALQGGQGQERAAYFEFLYTVEVAAKKELVLRFEQKIANENELDFDLSLILCLPNKPDKLEMILQKAVEIGVSGVVLVEGEFSQMKHNLRPERLQKIMAEAAEQSERAIIPELKDGGRLAEYLEGLGGENLANLFVAMERLEKDVRLQDLMKNKKSGAPVKILIGPEGGFSEKEKSVIAKTGVMRFSLGKRILRMETAAILSLGIAMNS